jgi:hypothetical protein
VIIKQIEKQHIGGINAKKEKQELAELLEQVRTGKTERHISTASIG